MPCRWCRCAAPRRRPPRSLRRDSRPTVVARPLNPLPPVLRLNAAVLIPPLAVPTRDVISERSANGVSLFAAPTVSARSSCRDVVAQRLQLRRERQESGDARTVASLLRAIDGRRRDDGLRNRRRLRLDYALLDDGLGLRLRLRLLAHDGRRRWRWRRLTLEHQTHEALRHFLGRRRIDLRLRAKPKTRARCTSAATSAPRASFLNFASSSSAVDHGSS